MAQIKCYKQGTPIELLAVIDDYISFHFTRSYGGLGKWELVLSANSLNAKRVEEMNFISLGGGRAGLVKKVDKLHIEVENTITFSGVELKGLAYNRIVEPPADKAYLSFYNKAPEFIIAQLLSTQVVNPTKAARRIANSSIAGYTQSTTKVSKDYRFKNVGEMIEELATAYNIGWYADIVNGVIEFKIYAGKNRSKGQTANDKLVVSYDRDTMRESRYTNFKHQPNTALVAGQGEGVERAIVMLGDDEVDIHRTELFIDARDIEDASDLPARGFEKLKTQTEENIYRLSLGQILIDTYRVNYDLGDIGTVEDELLGTAMDFTLTEATEVYENNTFNVEATFGLDKNSVMALIKRNQSALEAIGAEGQFISSGGGTITGNLNIGTVKLTPSDIFNGTNVYLHKGNYATHITPAGIGAAPASHSHNYLDNYGSSNYYTKYYTTSPANDFNNITNSLSLTAGANGPFGGNYTYLQNFIYSNENQRAQLAISYANNPGRMAFRTLYSGVWRGWYEVLHSGNYNSYVTPANIGAAAASHGNHVPTTQTANNAIYLRNDNTWQTITPAKIGAAASSHSHSYVPLSGGTVTGLLQISGQKTINTTTPGLTNYGLHFTGQTTADYATGITWNGGTGSTGAQAGIYVQGSGAYGTKMYFATTNAYVTGAITAISIDSTGVTNFVRSRPTALGNLILDAGNYNNYSPTKTGGGASGTWGISITGNAGSASSVAWGNVSGKPSTFTPATHSHSYLPLAGGALTGATTMAAIAIGTRTIRNIRSGTSLPTSGNITGEVFILT